MNDVKGSILLSSSSTLRGKAAEGAEMEGAERAGAGAEAREDRVARYVPLRTSVEEDTPAERMGEQSDTKELQRIVGVRRPLKGEKEEDKEEEEKEEEAEEEEREYPSLLRRDIANNNRQNNLVKNGKRGKRENGSKKKVVAGAGALSAETRYEVETNAERDITILASNDHMVLRRERRRKRKKRREERGSAL
ncbi:hypothetical protein CNMCM5623_002156 [Aspergillus felis]|uniref:Uncharacterized protein n=1 Tax=Aspergillus felis TaxID=1287682 RepID=A0A8H6QCE6_9EURO|nr:hypothetical protein CNMCM5623_002156 [Aspergillus felis]